MVILGIAGGSGSGKTTLVNQLLATYTKTLITHVPMDAYYHDQSHLSDEEKVKYNFDHPAAIDFDLLIAHLELLKNNFAIERPAYSFLTCTRQDHAEKIIPAEIILVDGLFVLSHQRLRQLLSLKLFLDVSVENRLNRSIRRDMAERGRTRNETKERFFSVVDPMHTEYVQPSSVYADVILPANSPDLHRNVSRIIAIFEERLYPSQKILT